MTFEPTPTMIEAAEKALVRITDDNYDVDKCAIEMLRWTVDYLQNNPDDARVFAEGFMKEVEVKYVDRSWGRVAYADGNDVSTDPLYRFPTQWEREHGRFVTNEERRQLLKRLPEEEQS